MKRIVQSRPCLGARPAWVEAAVVMNFDTYHKKSSVLGPLNVRTSVLKQPVLAATCLVACVQKSIGNREQYIFWNARQ